MASFGHKRTKLLVQTISCYLLYDIPVVLSVYILLLCSHILHWVFFLFFFLTTNLPNSAILLRVT